MNPTLVGVVEDENIMKLKSAEHQDLVEPDHSGKNAVIRTKINGNERNVDERVNDGRSNFQSKENPLAILSPCSRNDNSISI